MNSKTKKNLREYGIIGGVLLLLFATGLHTEVFGFLQRGILATGLMNPDVEQNSELAMNTPTTKADFNMKLIDSEGTPVALSDLKGKVIFFNIWATWCPPCIAEMPGINRLYNDVDQDEVAFVMLSVDQDFQKAVEFRKKKGFDFEIYRLAGPMPAMYATNSIPTTYVIDAEGNLALTHLGMGQFDTKDFKEFLEGLK